MRIINELHGCIDKYPHVIPYTNVSDSIFLKVNGNILKKRNNLLQTSVTFFTMILFYQYPKVDFMVPEMRMTECVLVILLLEIRCKNTPIQ